MTATAQRINETPMAPYASLLWGMTREQKQIVLMFITESMEETPNSSSKTKSNEEIIREKYKNLRISPRVTALVDGLSLNNNKKDFHGFCSIPFLTSEEFLLQFDYQE